ncbi:adhesion G protein-coupled receptor A3 isoform X2 [Venturia canescens]|uniref:adhesion G protein-coupled receptor A3 isoform X2 n=1 Tax=Venturia canescens TaxID=32260 RepID=UPI001C9C9B70|nr:adhesion G protein-coupled receptor A3 isoform X2 [Venturia canescens]
MRVIFLLISALTSVLAIDESRACPIPCSCKHVGPQAERLKITCKDVHDIKDININEIGIDLYHLDLSKNNLYVVESGVFRNLTNLKRLDLSVNKITALGEGCLNGLESLERLDLSKNQISVIDAHVFRPLQNLKKLKLNGNALKTMAEGTFYGLRALRQLDLSNNPWACDCYLFWFGTWRNNSVVKLLPPPTCDSPLELRGQPIVDIRLSEHLQCQWASPVIEIRPGQSQVVFAGDSITLKCRAPSITEDRNAKLNWLWNPNITTEAVDTNVYVDPQNTLSNVKVENRYLSDSGIVASSLSIVPVQEEHHGQWNCFLVSIYGNRSKTINMIVISDKTQYCPLAVTRNNKGMYAWPRTVVGWKVELPCEGIGLSTLMQIPLRASYRCNRTGHWEELNTDACPYISPMTKALEQYSKVNLSLTKGNLLETARRFKNHTGEASKITDPVEIHFVTKTIENYLAFLIDEKELGTMLVDIVSALMNLPKDMLKSAQKKYNACARLVKAIEVVTEFTSSIQVLHKNNMALEEFRFKRDEFVGLTCTWYNDYSSITTKATRSLQCTTNNKSAVLSTKDKTIEASIQLPASLLAHPNASMVGHQLMISMYSDNSLFPKVYGNRRIDVTSCVVGSKLIGQSLVNLSEPVYVMLKAPRYYYVGSRSRPVVWDEKFNETGGWTSDGCHLSDVLNDLVVFRCYRLGYYGLLEDTSYLDDDSMNLAGAKFRYSNPAIYIGSFLAIVCLTFTAVTYIVCYASIVMPKKAKHSVVNTWVALALLCFLYTAGIQQTDSIEICQGVGLVLHYLSLCCLLWMTVSASNMYKRLSKSDVTAVPDDEIPDEPIQKPLLGLYLVGWGIALIVCGISGAINLREYAGYSYCFLTSGAALAALFVPAIILIAYLIIFYLLVRCAIRSVDMNGQLSEGTQATENMDLELLEPNSSRAADQNSVHSTQTMSSEVEDLEHSQITQLKGHIVILILYLMTWTSGAAATSKPFDPHVPHEETIFSIIYAISSSSLGLFVLLFYGIARSDVRSQWMMMRCWLRRRKNRCCRTRSVSDANPSLPAQPLVQQNRPPPVSNSQATQVISDSNSIASSRHTNSSRNAAACNTLKVSELGGVTNSIGDASIGAAKVANVNLVVLHRQQYRSNNSVTTYTEPAPSCVEMFYNPHQSGVARKFFKKQRRHTKSNNLGPRKQGDGGVTSDGGSCISIPRRQGITIEPSIQRNIFGSGAKVNNTNIHVELNPINDGKNINILSDSGGSVSEDRTVPMRYVIGHENLAKSTKKMNNERNSRQDYSESHAMLSSPSRHDSRRKPEQQPLTSASPNESDQDSRTYEEKILRNVSQQCSLEYSSGLESTTQMTSERSDHDLPEIGETPETPEKIMSDDLRVSSLEDVVQDNEEESSPRMSIVRPDGSGDFFNQPADRYDDRSDTLKNSYCNSMNDVEDPSISRESCYLTTRGSYEDFRHSDDPRKHESRGFHHRGSCKSLDSSRRSLNESTSFISENRPPLPDSIECPGSPDNEFQLLGELQSPTESRNYGTPDISNESIDQDPRDSFLAKDFNSTNDLTSIDESLGPTRNLDLNSSIEYEDSPEFRFSQRFDQTENEDGEIDIDADAVYTDGESSVQSTTVKKETSV